MPRNVADVVRGQLVGRGVRPRLASVAKQDVDVRHYLG